MILGTGLKMVRNDHTKWAFGSKCPLRKLLISCLVQQKQILCGKVIAFLESHVDIVVHNAKYQRVDKTDKMR